MRDGIPNNEDRAEWANSAVKAFIADTRGGHASNWTKFKGEDHADLIADLICDLGHYAKQHGLDYVELVQRGLGMWSAEDRDPDGDPYENDIATVSIEELPIREKAGDV